MKKRRGVYIIHMILIIVLITSTISNVFGNAGPPVTRYSDERLIFDEESGIALTEEWVTIDLSTVDEGRVEVRYLLENLHREEDNLELLFILPGESDSMEVSWNNERVENIEELPYNQLPGNWKSNIQRVNDPLSGKELMSEHYSHGAYSGYKGKQFSVDLPPGETGELILSYPNYSGFYRRNEVVNPVYHLIYYLTPALFWEGETKAHLEFRLPEGNYAINSNIPMESHEPGVYRSTLEQLPEEEWRISYASTSRLIFGSNERRVHNSLLGATIFLFIFMVGYLMKKKDIRFIWLSILIIPMLFFFSLGHGYGGIMYLLILAPIVAVLMLWALVYLFMKIKNGFISRRV